MIERLRAGADAVFAGTPVRFAYLVGSRAAGTAGPRSDVDVAVHLGGAPSSIELVLELVGRLERLSGVETDVVVLDTASLRWAHRVLGHAVVLYGTHEPLRVRYEAVMRRVTADFARHADAARFRNLLVHQYADIDDRRVIAILRERLADLERFRRAVAAPA